MFLAGNFGILPNPDKVLRKTGKTIDIYRDLKTDPHVWSCVQSRKSGILSLEFIISPNGATNSIVAEIEKMFSDMDIQQVERDILEAPLFGYQPLEILWNFKGSDRKFLYPEKIVAKPQEWFFYDTNGEFRYKKSGEPKGVPVPPLKILNVQYEASYLNPYGHSLLGKCYWPVIFKNGGVKFWVNFTEKYGMPILMGQYTRGATNDEAQRLADELANMTEDAVIVAPSDIKLEMHEAGRDSSVNLYSELIKFCNTEISKVILSQTLTTELDGGSYAAAQTHYQIRQEVIQSDIRLVEAAINKIIQYVVDLNFAGSKYPKFNILVNDADNVQKIDRDLKISQTGAVQFTKKYWMSSYGFKEDELSVS
jgi:phage gp29-like protein